MALVFLIFISGKGNSPTIVKRKVRTDRVTWFWADIEAALFYCLEASTRILILWYHVTSSLRLILYLSRRLIQAIIWHSADLYIATVVIVVNLLSCSSTTAILFNDIIQRILGRLDLQIVNHIFDKFAVL